jgi:hypothetical protein
MMDGWKIQELRAAVLSDLHEFIPRGHYSNVRKDVDIALNDYVLANRLKCAQYTAPQFTPRQWAAVWLLEKIGMYCIPYTSPDPEADAAEGITPESIKETSLEHLHDALKRYAAHLGAEENNALIPADALASVEQAATDGERIPVAKQQDRVILEWLTSNRHDPLNLPIPPEGKSGVKKVCRDALTEKNKHLFSSKKIFDTAWQRLRDDGNIRDEY